MSLSTHKPLYCRRTKDINTLGRGGNISDNVMRSTRDALTSVEIEEMARLVQEVGN